VGKLEAAGEVSKQERSGDGREKPLGLTAKGETTLAAIDAFAERQVRAALYRMPLPSREVLRDSLAAYADALTACRKGTPAIERADLPIACGYRPGLVGQVTEMHARTYAQLAGFGAIFEGKVAAGMADFIERLDNPASQIWTVEEAGRVAGSIAVDGEHLGNGTAHLRWFIVDERWRGAGLGRRLLGDALSFCDRQGFAETHLWTFRGLDAARALYETHGFQLVEEERGAQWGAEVVEQRFVRPRPVPVDGRGF
jgi:GNAT superfamily N-acetyltransferase